MNIVVRGTNWIGDAVMTIPALRELRRIFPKARITLLTRKWAEGIFLDADFIDDMIVFEEGGTAITTILDQTRRVRSQHYDLAVIFPNSFRSAAAIRLAGIPKRFGYSKEGRRILLTDALDIPDWKGERHEVYYYLNIVSEVEKAYFVTKTVADAVPNVSLGVSKERRDLALNYLAQNGCLRENLTIGLGAGSTNSIAKRWPAERFAELGDSLKSRFNANIVLLGSGEETDVARNVQDLAASKLVDLTSKTDLGLATSILSTIDLFVSNDMGLAHIAAAVGTPTVVVFGPTNPVTTRPFAPKVFVVREKVECSPCMLRECPIDHRCMTRITVDDVMKECVQALLTKDTSNDTTE